MDLTYLEQKLIEVLQMNQNNQAKAAKQLREMLYQDHRLLLELTLPYMTGIMAHGFSRVEGKAGQIKADEAQLSMENMGLNTVANDRAGKEMLRAFATQDTAKFGFEHSNAAPPVRRKAASQNHVDTIHMLAAKAKDKINRQDSGE